jgi:hypothetical protein
MQAENRGWACACGARRNPNRWLPVSRLLDDDNGGEASAGQSVHSYDAVIDFDKVLRDPAQPVRLRPEFDSGDHVHPNDLGHRAMADAIDLKFFRQD